MAHEQGTGEFERFRRKYSATYDNAARVSHEFPGSCREVGLIEDTQEHFPPVFCDGHIRKTR